MGMVRWTVRDNILGEVCDKLVSTAGATLTSAGERFKAKARAECPVSAIRTPGYVHLRDTIDYDTDLDTLYFQMWVQFFVIKNYAIYVNNGTSRMAGRPFFTDGVLDVQDHYEEDVEKAFRDLRAGRFQPK